MQVLSLLGKGNNYDQIGAKSGINYSSLTSASSSIEN